MSQDLHFFKHSGKMKFHCLLSDRAVDRPDLSSHEINDRNPSMTMSADTRHIQFSSRDRIPFNLLEIISNFLVRQSFGIIISNFFNTRAVHASLIFQEKMTFKLFNVILPKSKQSTYTCIVKKWPASAPKFRVESVLKINSSCNKLKSWSINLCINWTEK